MKRTVIIISVIIVTGLIYISFYKYLPPYSTLKSASLISGLKLSNDYFIERDTSVFSFTGEGYSEIILSLKAYQYEEFTERNKLNDFESLPILEELPATLPDYYYNYMDSDTLFKYYRESLDKEVVCGSGYYSLVKSKRNESYKLIVVDGSRNQILVYSFYD